MSPRYDALNEDERRAYEDDALVPEGWQWCPVCEGEGCVIVNDLDDARPRLIGRACAECHTKGIVLDVAIASGGDGPDTARTPARSERPGETVPATVVSPPDPPGAPPLHAQKGKP